MANKIIVSNYTFDASAKTITFNDYVSLSLEDILLITNVTDNIAVYNFALTGLGGTVATNVLTLDFDTTSMDDTDDLQIWYYDPNASSDVTVDNFPATYPLPSSQVTTLTPQTNALTDAQLRASAVPVSLSSSPLPTGASTLAEQQTQTTKLTSLDGKDFATQMTLATRLSESDFDTKIGSLTETAPASDTASSGLNGRLQRIAQRITSLIALFPTSLTGSGNFKVAVQEFTATVSTQGDVAHDSADSGNPQKIGFKAKSYGSLPSIVADGDRVNGVADRYGSPFVQLGSSYKRAQNLQFSANQTNQDIVTAGASEIIRVYAIMLDIDYDSQSVQTVSIGFGATTTPTTSGCLFDNQGIIPGHYRDDFHGVCGGAGEDLKITTTGYTAGTNSVRVIYDIIST